MFMPSVFKWLGLRPIFTAIWKTKPVQAMLTPLEAILTSQKWGKNIYEIALEFSYILPFHSLFIFLEFQSPRFERFLKRFLKIEGNENK